MEATLFFQKVEQVNPDAEWSVGTTSAGVSIRWDWDKKKLDKNKYHLILIPAEAMKDDVLVQRHLDKAKEEISKKL